MLITRANKGFPQSPLPISSCPCPQEGAPHLTRDRAQTPALPWGALHSHPPEAGGEGCLSHGQSQAFKKHPSQMSRGYLNMANTGHGRAQAGMHSPPWLTLLSSSLPQKPPPQREHTCTGCSAHLCFPTYSLMRDPSISENTTGVLLCRQHNLLSCSPRIIKNVAPPPSSF